MSVHEQFGEDLALYALGALEDGERASLEKHLEECASCRRELDQLRGDAALLALTASGPRPPARAKSRLMDAIATESKLHTPRPRLQWWTALEWLTAAVVVVFAIGFWRQNNHLSS